jgi:enoyl-CoA hydratase
VKRIVAHNSIRIITTPEDCRMAFTTLTLERDGRIGIVTINRPDKLNALNHDTIAELGDVFASLAADDAIGAIVLTGAGEKAFVAGADIAELNRQDALGGLEFARFGQDVFRSIERCPKPVIAAVNGFALGGGCELALACHIRIAAENAKFGQPEVNLGIIPGYGGTQRLARIIGLGRAAELVLTAALIDAQEAYRIGLANKVVPRGEALAAAKEMAAVIASKGPVAVRNGLEALRAVHETGLQEGIAIEASLFGLTCGSDDFKEGTAAFLEKRPATFSGK